MVYFLTFLFCEMGCAAFVLTVDPQFVPLSITIGMVVTFHCLAAMVCLAWYVFKRYKEQDDLRPDHLICGACKHDAFPGDAEPCCSCIMTGSNWEEPENDLQ